jgi:hypothetical protein
MRRGSKWDYVCWWGVFPTEWHDAFSLWCTTYGGIRLLFWVAIWREFA